MPNRLAQATSAYLRSAAHQPVEWYPWGEEPFRRARTEDKPILLDVGAVWCHWCHVIDRESYENREVAAIINQRFVPVKVDRDERPDVDVRYQNAVGALSGQGGWPLTAFLTPDGKVFFGGTYFPPDSAGGRPSFRQVLLAVSEFYRTKRDQAYAYADQLYQALQRLGDARASEDTLSPALLREAVSDIEGQFDPQHGGFGNAPKFPHPGAIQLLLRRHDRTRDPRTLLVVTRTLERMGRGGVYDQIGGGFHRYSVDAAWIVPHFEKMAYDNAELLRNYVHAFQATGTPLFRDVALGIVGYVSGTLMDRDAGGFYASQDADISLHDDGDYYTWTADEAAAALPPDEWEAVRLAYHLDGPGEMHHDPRRHVLFMDNDADVVAARLGRPIEDVRVRLASGRRRLLEVRMSRPAPFVDRTLYTGWNGMMISAFLEAARGLGLGDARDAALRALDRIVRDAYTAGQGFRHVAGTPGSVGGLLEDQVHMARALLDAFEHTAEPRHLRLARETVEYVLGAFQTSAGAFYDRANGATDDRAGAGLAIPYVPVQDAPSPAGNGVAVLVLDRLAALTGDARYRDAADRALRACAPANVPQGLSASTLALALDLHLDPPLHVVIVGPRGDPRTRRLQGAALAAYRPGTIVHVYDPSQHGLGPDSTALPVPVPARAADVGEPRAYACTATACAAPTGDPDALREAIRTFGRPAA
jgi:uncharacterized protein YyaL (SSP411 family)